MKLIQENVKLQNVQDAFSGVCLADPTQTIIENLDGPQLGRYIHAIEKIRCRKGLNPKDLVVFNLIDTLTYKHHGMCLKDSRVTLARLKACKKHKIPFIDRDGLLEHMRLSIPQSTVQNELNRFCKMIGDDFTEKMGADAEFKLREILEKLDHHEDFTINDLAFLSEIEEVAHDLLDWTIVDRQMKVAIKSASEKTGVYFTNLQNI